MEGLIVRATVLDVKRTAVSAEYGEDNVELAYLRCH